MANGTDSEFTGRGVRPEMGEGSTGAQGDLFSIEQLTGRSMGWERLWLPAHSHREGLAALSGPGAC